MPNRILISRASLSRGSRNFPARVVTALARLGHIYLSLRASKLCGKVIITSGCIPFQFDALAANFLRSSLNAIRASYFLRLTLNGRNKVFLLARGLPADLIASALSAGPAIVISAAWLSHSQSLIPPADVRDAHHLSTATEVRLIADRVAVEREGDIPPGFDATDCLRIITGLIVQGERARDPVHRITVTGGIRN